MSIAVIDYGMGNLRSVTQAVMHVAADAGVEVVWARTPQEVMAAERVRIAEIKSNGAGLTADEVVAIVRGAFEGREPPDIEARR